jgi:Na+-driven multidrug efflux pump
VQQRARLICWTASLPVVLLWAYAEPLLLALGQQPELAALAARNLWLMVPGLFFGVCLI